MGAVDAGLCQGQERLLAEERSLRPCGSRPGRDVSRARGIAVRILERSDLRCVWTDQPLSRATLDVDHMFPWTAWPCGDLWNLLPAHRQVNQRLKRDRLPSASTLYRAEGRIIGWWEEGYLSRDDTPLPVQFLQEARASLPALSNE
jgi:hypothetical protein